MKSLKKLTLVLLALLTLFTATSCKLNEDDDDDNALLLALATQKIARFYGIATVTVNGTSVVEQMTINFYGNNTFDIVLNVAASNGAAAATREWTEAKGTYTGNPRLNNTTILCTTTYEYNESLNRLVLVTPYTDSISIINGQITITDDDDPSFRITLTRQ